MSWIDADADAGELLELLHRRHHRHVVVRPDHAADVGAAQRLRRRDDAIVFLRRARPPDAGERHETGHRQPEPALHEYALGNPAHRFPPSPFHRERYVTLAVSGRNRRQAGRSRQGLARHGCGGRAPAFRRYTIHRDAISADIGECQAGQNRQRDPDAGVIDQQSGQPWRERLGDQARKRQAARHSRIARRAEQGERHRAARDPADAEAGGVKHDGESHDRQIDEQQKKTGGHQHASRDRGPDRMIVPAKDPLDGAGANLRRAEQRSQRNRNRQFKSARLQECEQMDRDGRSNPRRQRKDGGEEQEHEPRMRNRYGLARVRRRFIRRAGFAHAVLRNGPQI